ncbi:enoyl-CoA hydratase/isomerase family protein [Geodermatophilus sp. SYSU D01186]
MATLELTRPDRLNAIRRQTLEELAAALTEIERAPEVGVVIVTGAGRAFCAGADIGEIDGQDQAAGDAFTREGQEVFDRLAASPVVSIAAVHGYALGGGLELAMACDRRIAASSAQVGQPEAALGHLPAWGGTQRLPRLVGRAAALRMMITGRRVPAAEALQLGLVDEVVADGRLTEVVQERAAELAAPAAAVVRAIKAAVDAGQRAGLSAGLHAERLGMSLCRGLPESNRRRSEFLTHNQA